MSRLTLTYTKFTFARINSRALVMSHEITSYAQTDQHFDNHFA